MLSQLINPITSIIDKFIPDADTKQKIAYELATLADNHAQQIALAQIELNKIESAGNWFQSGWRPATGWVCVAGFLVNFLISPLAAGFDVIIPQADLSVMLPVLMGMLGLGTLRTFEKSKKVA
tara:strand:- start:630 stop:998 length:369 start_codon:yes stop_codon:yes gene_type:complete